MLTGKERLTPVFNGVVMPVQEKCEYDQKYYDKWKCEHMDLVSVF
jgi:hypothetical protein